MALHGTHAVEPVEQVVESLSVDDHVHQRRLRRLVLGYELGGEDLASSVVLRLEVSQARARGTELDPHAGKLSLLHYDAVLQVTEALLQVADPALEPPDLVGVRLDRPAQLVGA